jgi:hypothetical protein
VQGVGGQLGGVALGRAEAQLLGQVAGSPATRIEEGRSLDALRDGARGRRERAAALGVEAGLRHAIALDLHRDAHQVATRRAASRTAVRMLPEGALSVGLVEVFGERPH